MTGADLVTEWDLRVSRKLFTTTKWPILEALKDPEGPGAQRALEHLCNKYWHPFVIYARSTGFSAEEAEDLTQGFFTMMIERQGFARADARRGRLRSFLMTAFRNFISNENARGATERRGGKAIVVSIDSRDENMKLKIDPADSFTPRDAFERNWAETLLQRVLEQLGREMEARQLGHLFQEVKSLLHGEKSTSYAEIAARTNSTEGAIKVAVHRIRKRYRELLRAEIALTVANPDEIDDELRELVRIATRS